MSQFIPMAMMAATTPSLGTGCGKLSEYSTEERGKQEN